MVAVDEDTCISGYLFFIKNKTVMPIIKLQMLWVGLFSLIMYNVNYRIYKLEIREHTLYFAFNTYLPYNITVTIDSILSSCKLDWKLNHFLNHFITIALMKITLCTIFVMLE